MARTTGGRMSCDKKKNEMSLLPQRPNLYSKRLSPYAASEPIATARAEAPSDAMALFTKRFRNSSRTVDSAKIVSGDSPSDCQPFQFGVKSSQGTRCPWVTSRPSLNDVEN